MSQNSGSRRVTLDSRTMWSRYALSLQLSLAFTVGAAGCNSVSNSQMLSSKLSAPANEQVGAPIIAASSKHPSANTENRTHAVPPQSAASMRSTPASDVITVSCEEQNTVAARQSSTAGTMPSTEKGITNNSAHAPLMSLASCQVSGSCAPATGNGCGCGGSSCNTCTTTGSAGMNVQEYIFDGGDIDPQLGVRRDRSVAGLNPTDTIAYYETYDGKLCVTPTNRVPIYAPRFGAVRKVTGAIISDHAVSTQRILAPVSPGRFDDKNLATAVVQPVAPLGEERVSLIDALQDKNLGVPVAQVLPLHRMSDAIVPFENLELVGTGKIQDKEIAVLGQFLLNARTWVTPESLQVLIDDQQTSEQLDVKQVQDIHVYELPEGKCSLRIYKAASHMVADSGDTISFTIRFDNAGAQPIGKVVILDSLSPRLEYIEGSQQCSVTPAPKFSADPNEVGSTVLRWEIEQALKPGDGGVIHFRCLVR